MREILCTPALIKEGKLQLEEAQGPAESWAAHVFPFQRKQMLCFMHLPTQYAMLIGPFGLADLHNVRQHFKDALWGAMNTDGFASYLVADIMALFDPMELCTGTLTVQQINLFEAFQKGFGLYAKAAGDDLDLDFFGTQIRDTQGPGMAAVSPRATFTLWAQSISGDD